MMAIRCNACNQDNRDIAKFCKFCGNAVAAHPVENQPLQPIGLDRLIGLTEIKEEIQKIITAAKNIKARGRSLQNQRLHTILIGNTGTAKSKIAGILAQLYFDNGIISKKDPTIVNAVDYAQFAKDLSNNYKSAKGGILFIDNVHKLVPAGYTGGQITQLDKLYSEMEANPFDPIVILASLPEGFKEYLEANPDVKNKFRFIFSLPDLTAEEMFALALERFQFQHFSLSSEAETKLQKPFRYLVKTKNRTFGNGHLVAKIVENTIQNYYLRSGIAENKDVIIAEDIKGYFPEEEINLLDMSLLRDKLSQVHCQEDNVSQLLDSLEIWNAQLEKSKPLTLFLVGTSGVGKTSTVDLLAEALKPLGYEYCYFTMTEFSQEHAVSNLIGSPKGYVGSEDEPKLFEALGRSKKLVICFDEIEKAHDKILKALMQLMDKGFLSWSKGEGDFRECIIFFTSNAQMAKMVDLKSKFRETGRSIEDHEFQEAVRDILVKAQVAAEVCGRISRFLVFNPLTPEAVMAITHQEVKKLARRYGIDVMYTAPEFLAEMAEKTAGSMGGARPIQQQVSSKLGKALLSLKRESPDVKQAVIKKGFKGYEAVAAHGERIPPFDEVIGEAKMLIKKRFEVR